MAGAAKLDEQSVQCIESGANLSVLTVDDDVQLSMPLIERMIAAHTREPTRLLGLDARSYTADGQYSFNALPNRPVLVIGKTMLGPAEMGVKYTADASIQDFNDDQRYFGCDDIARILWPKGTVGLEALVIPMDTKHGRDDLPESDGLSTQYISGFHRFISWFQGDKWPAKRTDCVKWMLAHI